MEDTTKNVFDVVLASLTVIGAVVAFIIGWRQWRVGLKQWERSQAWQRAEKLDKFVEKFETDALLRLGAVILDWTDRKVMFGDRELKVCNDEALLALRDHRTIEDRIKFPGEQATLRDAYDALLAFFNRLELAIDTKLIDASTAKAYFSYWLERLVLFDRHKRDDKILNGAEPAGLMATYIDVYGDKESIKRLCEHFGIPPPRFKLVRRDSAMPKKEVGLIETALISKSEL